MKTIFQLQQDDGISSIPILIKNHECETTINIDYGISFDDEIEEKLLSGFMIMGEHIIIDMNTVLKSLKEIFPTTYKEVFDILIKQAQELELY